MRPFRLYATIFPQSHRIGISFFAFLLILIVYHSSTKKSITYKKYLFIFANLSYCFQLFKLFYFAVQQRQISPRYNFVFFFQFVNLSLQIVYIFVFCHLSPFNTFSTSSLNLSILFIIAFLKNLFGFIPFVMCASRPLLFSIATILLASWYV